MRVPQRPFRGANQALEVQVQAPYAALDQRLSSDNAAMAAWLPIGTVAATGGTFALHGGNMAWWPTTFSFASSTAAQVKTVTHALGRAPQMYVNGMLDLAQVYLLPASTTAWNSASVYFSIASGTVSQGYRVIVL